VGDLARLRVVPLDVAVGVPPAAAAAVELDEADPALDQAPREQAVAAELPGERIVETVELARGFGFLLEIDRLRSRGLHPVGKLVTLEARLQFAVSPVFLRVAAVQVPEQVELAALLGLPDRLRGRQVEDRRSLIA